MSEGLGLEGVMAERGRFCLGPVDLSVARGETVWLAGPNGTGKSTLIGVIAGLIPVTAGCVVFDGTTLDDGKQTMPAWRRPLGILLQGLGLWPHLTIERQCRLVSKEAGSASRRIDELARPLGVETFLGRKPGALSGGEAQRCALLRALVPGAPLLLLDEPFSEQHEDGIARIEGVLESARESGSTIIVAGHRSVAGARRFELGGKTSC